MMTPPPIPALEADARVGPYRILGTLGGGGMGMVYRAVHTLLDRPAAIKVLRPELGNLAMALDRFQTEARATTAIRHPGIVEIYDYGFTESGHAFIAMELLQGESLATRLERGPLAVPEALVIARRIAAPLAVAHERGVVHRDLKPDNIFLVKDHEGGVFPQVKILDFGIAKLQNASGANRTTMGLVMGTPAYMSPEQCRGVADCDARSDLYALGCILFELLTGQPPYGTSLSSGELLVAHLSAPVPELGRFATVPSEICRLVSKLLAKRADDRPRHALEVVAELDRWLATRTTSTGALRPPPTRVFALRSSRRSVLTASGVAVALAGAGLWLGLTRKTTASQPVPYVDTRSISGPEQFPAPLPSPIQPSPAPPAPIPPPAAKLTATDVPPVPPPSTESPAATAPTTASPSRPARSSRRSSAGRAEVTSDLGKATAGDVHTLVNDLPQP